MIPQNLKNNFYFKKILKYCSLSIKSESEVLQKLRDYEIDSEELSEILETLRKFKFFFPDDEYISRFLENLSSLKGYSKLQLKQKLLRKGLPSKLINAHLDDFFKKNEDEQVEKFIKKNYSKLLRKEKVKRIAFLVSKGFGVDSVKKHLKNLDL
jgi:SOS response regulatory protein OraA/RecX